MNALWITVDGVTYKSKPDNTDIDRASDQWYDAAGKIDSFKMKLENGDILVLPKEAIQRAHIVFKANVSGGAI